MAISLSVSSSLKGNKLDLEIYEISTTELELMETQGFFVAVNLAVKPHVIEVAHLGRVERLVIDESLVPEVIRNLIIKGEEYEEYETCHELLKIQKMITND